MKKLGLCLTAAAMALIMATPVYAGSWKQVQKQTDDGPVSVWNYIKDNGQEAVSEWVDDNGNWYYMDDKGTIMKNHYTPDGYAVGDSGIWVQSIPKLHFTDSQRNAYRQILMQKYEEEQTDRAQRIYLITSYTVLDLNNDGITELIVYVGDNDHGYRYEVYTCADGSAKLGGSFDANNTASNIVTDGKGNTYLVHWKNNAYWVVKITFDGSAVTETRVPVPAGLPQTIDDSTFEKADTLYKEQLGLQFYLGEYSYSLGWSLLDF